MLPDPVEYNHAAPFLAQYRITKDASDQALIRRVNNEMRDWTLAKIVWVTSPVSSQTASTRRGGRQPAGWRARQTDTELRSGRPCR